MGNKFFKQNLKQCTYCKQLKEINPIQLTCICIVCCECQQKYKNFYCQKHFEDFRCWECEKEKYTELAYISEQIPYFNCIICFENEEMYWKTKYGYKQIEEDESAVDENKERQKLRDLLLYFRSRNKSLDFQINHQLNQIQNEQQRVNQLQLELKNLKRKNEYYRAKSLHYKKKKSQEDESKKCIVCFEAQKNVVFRDCGHYCTCTKCAKMLKKCPLCRKRLTVCVTVYDVV